MFRIINSYGYEAFLEASDKLRACPISRVVFNNALKLYYPKFSPWVLLLASEMSQSDAPMNIRSLKKMKQMIYDQGFHDNTIEDKCKGSLYFRNKTQKHDISLRLSGHANYKIGHKKNIEITFEKNLTLKAYANSWNDKPFFFKVYKSTDREIDFLRDFEKIVRSFKGERVKDKKRPLKRF